MAVEAREKTIDRHEGSSFSEIYMLPKPRIQSLSRIPDENSGFCMAKTGGKSLAGHRG
jgi:hypothetical protein